MSRKRSPPNPPGPVGRPSRDPQGDRRRIDRRGCLSALAGPGGDALPHPATTRPRACTWSSLLRRLLGRLDEDAFARSWGLLTARHGTLRTSFLRGDSGRMLQVVHRQVQLPDRVPRFPRQTPSPLSPISSAKTAPSDSTQPSPPCSALALIREADEEWRLIFTSHQH